MIKVFLLCLLLVAGCHTISAVDEYAVRVADPLWNPPYSNHNIDKWNSTSSSDKMNLDFINDSEMTAHKIKEINNRSVHMPGS